MSCNTVCRICPRLVISQSVAVTDGNVEINLPAGSYENGRRYCIVVAQSIPEDATITAPVYVTIGDGTELYPLTTCGCSQVTACGIRTRTRYATVVSTSASGGSFRMLGKPCCSPDNRLTAIDGGTTTTTEGGA